MVVRNLPIGFFALDLRRKIIEFNPAAEQSTGYARAEAIGMACSEILKTGMAETACPFRQVGEGIPLLVGQRAVLHTRDFREMPVVFTLAPLEAEDRRVLGGIVMFSDVSESERLERHRKVLISMFAHDLKAPLSIAGGFINRLLQNKGGELLPKQREYVDAIHRELLRLDSHIRSFLDILKMEAGEVPLSREACALDRTLTELAHVFRVEAARKEISLRIDIPRPLTHVLADPKQLERVSSNLLDNAIKYSPQGSEIIIRAYETQDSLVCEVKDSGSGIPEEDLPHIFDPFFRGRRATVKASESGSGLGLAVVRSIVEAHGGKIWVNTEPGKGSTFIYTIPKKEVHASSM